MTEDWDDPEPEYECLICGKQAHDPRPIVLCEWNHTKKQTKDAIKRLLRL